MWCPLRENYLELYDHFSSSWNQETLRDMLQGLSMSSQWEIPVHFHCEIFTFRSFVPGALQMESRILFKGEILWLINCQRFPTSKGPLKSLLWSQQKCQCLIWTGKIFECFCSSPPCVQVQHNTGVSLNIRPPCQDQDNNALTLLCDYRQCSVDLWSKQTLMDIWVQ